MDYFSLRRSGRPGAIRTNTRPATPATVPGTAPSTAPGTAPGTAPSTAPGTPLELKSPMTLLSVPQPERPIVGRTITSATLATANEKFYNAVHDESVETETCAFAFDIDGVLVKGEDPIPGARETLKMLQEKKIPFIFLTNGGGLTEAAHVAKLGMRLNLTLDVDQFVQSHSPFHDLVPKYHDKTILVLGGTGDNIRDLARAYGFQKVVTSSDLMQEWAHIHPFPELTRDHHAQHGRRLPENMQNSNIAAILVICDLLLSSDGKFGKRSVRNGSVHLPNNGYLQDRQPKLYFCNPDFEWATQHDHPRFAQGAFREALKGIWSHVTKDAKLEYTIVGKPTEATYVYGEKVLHAYNEKLNQQLPTPRKIKTVYMIGDNPESDIRGANTFKSHLGSVWHSVLVRTGVYEAGTKPTYMPSLFIADNIASAVYRCLAGEELDRSDRLHGRTWDFASPLDQTAEQVELLNRRLELLAANDEVEVELNEKTQV